MKNYPYIILPPDAFHLTIKDLIYDERQLFISIIDMVNQVMAPIDNILVKYRTENQKKNFPCNSTSTVGYGKLLDYCGEKTRVIGPLGSAAIECLSRDIPYYAYQLNNSIQSNRAIYNMLSEALYVADCAGKLMDHLKNNKIYRHGYSKRDLLHENGLYLHQIVELILSK